MALNPEMRNTSAVMGCREQKASPIIVASVVGIVLSLIQAITQLQEQTLAFGVKLLAVGLTLFLMGKWLSGEILRYSEDIFNRFYLL